jgi:hypothetical protein
VFQKPVEKQTLQAILQKSSRKSGARLADRPK